MSAVQRLGPRWQHTDSDPKRTLAMALSAPDYRTLTTEGRVRTLRSLVLATVYAVENARDIPVAPPGEMQILTLDAAVSGDQYRTRQHCYAASTIARSLLLFVDPGRHRIYDATTHDGEPAVLDKGQGDAINKGEAGFPPLLVAAVAVVGVAAFAVAACYCAQAAAEVIDRKLTEDQLTARMIATQARAVAMVDAHKARERGGDPDPWSPEELKVLDALLDTQRAIAERSHTPLPNPFHGAVEAAGDVGRHLADKAGTGIELGVIAAAIAAGAYVMTR